MMGELILTRSPLVTLANKVAQAMDVILHIGAHRTASTSFQRYLRLNGDDLRQQGVAFWGPARTRTHLFPGLVPWGGMPISARSARLARGRIAVQCQKAADKGVQSLIVSDENILGGARHNTRTGRLYDLAEQMSGLYGQAFGQRINKVVLTIRSLDGYWASALAFAIGRGRHVPGTDMLDRLVTQPRSWRHVVRDVAVALPETQIDVLPYETFGGRHESRLHHMLDARITPPQEGARIWLNKAPDLAALRQHLAARGEDPTHLRGEGRYAPFDPAQRRALRETYADDLFWLRAGADGLATIIEEKDASRTGKNLPGGSLTRGLRNDQQKGRMA